jgi:hypothetical protein
MFLLVGTCLLGVLVNSYVQTHTAFRGAAPWTFPAIGFAVASTILVLLSIVNRAKVVALKSRKERIPFMVRPTKALFFGLFIFLAFTGAKAIALLAKGSLDQTLGNSLGNFPIFAIGLGIYMTAYRHPDL